MARAWEAQCISEMSMMLSACLEPHRVAFPGSDLETLMEFLLESVLQACPCCSGV